MIHVIPAKPDNRRTVILFYPQLFAGQRVEPSQLVPLPLPVLALAGALRGTEYKIRIIDGKLEHEYEKIINELHTQLLCVGISALTGQVHQGLKLDKYVKSNFPEIPVVWGGWHATISHTQTITSPYVDIIVRGVGEVTFTELLDHLQHKESLGHVRGITYKEDGDIKVNPPRVLEKQFISPPFPYEEVIDLPRYELSQGKLNYISSRGCPYNCGYCSIHQVFNRKWIPKSAEQVVDELTYFRKRYSLNYILFQDDNFFVDIHRVFDICDSILKKGLKFQWEANGHLNELTRVELDSFKLLRKAGCNLISTGVESASPNMLRIMNKNIQPDKVINLAKILKSSNIPFRANFMVGLPEETQDDLMQTFKLIAELVGINSHQVISIGMYYPIPGSSMYHYELQRGIKIQYPKTIEQWANFHIEVNRPWLYNTKFLKRYRDREYIKRMCFYLWIGYLSSRIKEKIRNNKLYQIFHKVTILRLNRKWFMVPVEWWMFKILLNVKRSTPMPVRLQGVLLSKVKHFLSLLL